jgi:ubiquinone/menaquinone biosynthesis C-methylase UbiE
MIISEPRRDPEKAEPEILQRYASQPGGRILDIGCGDGRLTWLYARDASLVAGSDIDLTRLRNAQMARPEGVSTQVYFTAAQGEAMPFANETFDLAIFSWSL